MGHCSAVAKAVSNAVRLAGNRHVGQYVQSSRTMRIPLAIQNGEIFLQFMQSNCDSANKKPQYMQGEVTSALSLASSARGFRTIFSIFFLYCSAICCLCSGRMSIHAYW